MQRKDSPRLEKSSRSALEPPPGAEERLTSLGEENRELRKSLARMDLLFESLPSVFVVIQEGKVKEITRKGLDALGYRLEEVQGIDFAHLVHPSYQLLFSDCHESELAGGPMPREVELLTKNGKGLECDLTFHNIHYEDRAAVLAEIAPAAPRRERERNLVMSQKDDLIAMMSSGLVRKLTPSVQALNDYAARLKTRSGPTSAPDALLAAAADELAALTRCLEMLSGKESIPSRILPFDLAKVVQDAISQVEEKIQSAGRQAAPIKMQYYLRHASPVEGDPEEVRDVVIGLITNAVESMPEGGDLYISAEENEGYACVYIQDSGTSVPREILPKITDPFFTTKGRGSDGLGLCMARAVLRRHRGDLRLESSTGRGTTISIRMPLSRDGAGHEKTCAKKRKNTWILILEEDSLIRDLFFQVLSCKGYKVETAELFSEAFERLKSRPFDLVIAGTVTGNPRGLVRRIRKSAPRAFLAMIGGLGNGDAPGRFPPGSVDLVIGKPIDMNWTLSRISELLIGRAK